MFAWFLMLYSLPIQLQSDKNGVCITIYLSTLAPIFMFLRFWDCSFITTVYNNSLVALISFPKMLPEFQHVRDGSEQDIMKICEEYQRVGRPISYSASWVNWLVSSAHIFQTGMHECTHTAVTLELEIIPPLCLYLSQCQS